MGKLLRISRYETTVTRHGRMATPQDKGNLLETMEESSDANKKAAESELTRMGGA